MHTKSDSIRQQMLAKIEQLGTAAPLGLDTAREAAPRMAALYWELDLLLSDGEPLPEPWRKAVARRLRGEAIRLSTPPRKDNFDQVNGLLRAAAIIGQPQKLRSGLWLDAAAEMEDNGDEKS